MTKSKIGTSLPLEVGEELLDTSHRWFGSQLLNWAVELVKADWSAITCRLVISVVGINRMCCLREATPMIKKMTRKMTKMIKKMTKMIKRMTIEMTGIGKIITGDLCIYVNYL